MAGKFLLAQFKDGTFAVSEFEKVNVEGSTYAGQVFRGEKPFNVWNVVRTTHPKSGEPVVIRTRTMVNGDSIKALTPVEPMVADHSYDPANFRAVETMQRGERGIYTVPAEVAATTGLVAGDKYPLHFDGVELRPFIVVDAATNQRFYTEAAVEPEPIGSSFDDDDDDRDDRFEDNFTY